MSNQRFNKFLFPLYCGNWGVSLFILIVGTGAENSNPRLGVA